MQTKKLIALLSVAATFDETSARVTDLNETQELRLADSSPATDAKHSGKVQLLQMDDTDAMETREERAPPRKVPPIPGLRHINLLPKKAIEKVVAPALKGKQADPSRKQPGKRDQNRIDAEKAIEKAVAPALKEEQAGPSRKQPGKRDQNRIDAEKLTDVYLMKGKTLLQIHTEFREKFGKAIVKKMNEFIRQRKNEWPSKFAGRIAEAETMITSNTPRDKILDKITAPAAVSELTSDEIERLTYCVKYLFEMYDRLKAKFQSYRLNGESAYSVHQHVKSDEDVTLKAKKGLQGYVNQWFMEGDDMDKKINDEVVQNEKPPLAIWNKVKPTNQHVSDEESELFLKYIEKWVRDYGKMKKKFNVFYLSDGKQGIRSTMLSAAESKMFQVTRRIRVYTNLWLEEWNKMESKISELLQAGKSPSGILEHMKPTNRQISIKETDRFLHLINQLFKKYTEMKKAFDTFYVATAHGPTIDELMSLTNLNNMDEMSKRLPDYMKLWSMEWKEMSNKINELLVAKAPRENIWKAVVPQARQLSDEESKRFSYYINKWISDYDEMKNAFDNFYMKRSTNPEIGKVLKFPTKDMMPDVSGRLPGYINIWLMEWGEIDNNIDELLRAGQLPSTICQEVKLVDHQFSIEENQLFLDYVNQCFEGYHRMNTKIDDLLPSVPRSEITKEIASVDQVTSMDRIDKRVGERISKWQKEFDVEITKKLQDWLIKSDEEVNGLLTANRVPRDLVAHYFQKLKGFQAEMEAFHREWSLRKFSPAEVAIRENLAHAAKGDLRVKYFELYKGPNIATGDNLKT